jgi:hypothetical protein
MFLLVISYFRGFSLGVAMKPWATVRRTSQILDYTPINNRNPDPPRGVGKFWISIIGVSGSESRSQRFHHLRLARGYGWLSLAGRESETSTTDLPSPGSPRQAVDEREVNRRKAAGRPMAGAGGRSSTKRKKSRWRSVTPSQWWKKKNKLKKKEKRN